MNTLTIADLPAVQTMDRNAMAATRGGIAYLTKPGTSGDPVISPPASWPCPLGAIFKDFHLAGWPASPGQPAADPRLL
jgi:hypothetical protein